MNLKKTLAGLAAGTVALSTMATLAVSAQDAATYTYDTYAVDYYVETTVTAKAALANTAAGVQVVTWTATLGTYAPASADDVSIKSAALNGTAVSADDLDVVVKKPTPTTVTVNGLGLDQGKVVTVTYTTKKQVADKDAAVNGAKAINDSNEVIDSTVAATKTYYVKGDANGVNAAGSIKAKAVSDKYFLQLGAKESVSSGKSNVDKGTWVGVNGGIGDDTNNIHAAFAVNPLKSAFMARLDTQLANDLASNRGAKLVFYFQDKMTAKDDGLASAPDYSQDTGWSDGATEDFAIRVNGTKALTGIGMVDADALSISFDWDTVLAKSNLTNAVGQVWGIEFKANKDGFLYNGDFDNDKGEATFRYEITKIAVVVPATDDVVDDMSDLAAGEAETTVEAALPDAGAADTTAATDAAANPVTGNSAVALVAIPVALAAAAIVAKKRG